MLNRVVIAAALLLTTNIVSAQSPETATEKPPQWLIGMSLGMPGSGAEYYPEFFTVGMQFTEVKEGEIGADLSIGTMPALLQPGAIPLGFRGDITFPLVSPHVIVLPEAGTSVIGTAGPSRGGAILGLNAGIAAVVHSAGMGLRVGITFHQFIGLPNAVWLAEVGFVSIGVDPP